VECETAEQARDPRHLQTRKCLHGHAERLVRLEGMIVLLLFLFGFFCYRVRLLAVLHAHAFSHLLRFPGFFLLVPPHQVEYHAQ
jgi:hypothetical protein